MILAKGSPQVLVRTMYSYTHSFHVLSRNASQWCNTTWVQCLQWSKLESSIEWFLNVAYQAVHNGEQLWYFWVCGNSLFLWNPAILWFQTLEIRSCTPCPSHLPVLHCPFLSAPPPSSLPCLFLLSTIPLYLPPPSFSPHSFPSPPSSSSLLSSRSKDLPVPTELQMSHFSESCVLVQWSPIPSTYTTAVLQGYRVYVNGNAEGMVGVVCLYNVCGCVSVPLSMGEYGWMVYVGSSWMPIWYIYSHIHIHR